MCFRMVLDAFQGVSERLVWFQVHTQLSSAFLHSFAEISHSRSLDNRNLTDVSEKSPFYS